MAARRSRRTAGVTLLVGELHALDPRVDLALAEPQLGADTESAGAATLAAKVVDRLDRDLQLAQHLHEADNYVAEQEFQVCRSPLT